MPDLPHSPKNWFFPPQLPSDYIERKHLDPKFEQADSIGLLLLTAPSGYGKSLAVAAWLAGGHRSYSWLSLSPRHGELSHFIMDLVHALRVHHPEFGQEALELSHAMEIPSADTFGQLLVQELSTLKSRFYLVLDDYHLVHNPELDQLLELLVTSSLPEFRFILLTRQDPSLPLAQWRMKHRLVEIRAKDLIFSLDEITQFIHRNRNLRLEMEAIKALEKKSEGWISGLRLLLMSTSSEQLENPSFAQGSTGISSSLFDLIHEILTGQPEHIRLPLLKLALLPEFDEEFYTATLPTPGKDSPETMDFQNFVNYLKSSNFFLIELDRTGKWYRYHHLFRDLLAGMIPEYFSAEEQETLQMSLARTCMDKSMYEQAIGHFLSAGNKGAAVAAFARIRNLIFSESSWQNLDRIFSFFPKDLSETYSILRLTEAWLYIYKGNIPRMIGLLDPLKHMIEKDSCDEQQRIHYMGELEVLKAYGRYNFDIDMEVCLGHSKNALRMLGDSNAYATGLAWVFYGGSLQALGESERAKDEIYAELEISDDLQIQSNLYLILCYIYWIDGDLRDLRNTASHLIRFGQSHKLHEALANGYYFSGIANYHMNQAAKSKKALEEFYALRPYTILVHQFFGTTALAFLQLNIMDEERLDDLLLELEVMALDKGGPIFMDFSRAIAAMLRWTKSKDPTSLKWARQYNPLPLIPMSNFVALPLLQAYILASSSVKRDQLKAVEILETSVDFLRKNHNSLFLTRSWIILTLAYANLKEVDQRNKAFEEAVSLAEPRNLALSLRMLNAHLAPLLESCALSEVQREFLEKNLKTTTPSGQSPDPRDLLTRRELEILEQVCTYKTNKEIGNSLFISEKTVKRHIANIYQKLQIRNRKEAIQLLSIEKEKV